MQIFLRKYLILLALIFPISSISQEDKIIEIKQSGGSRQDQDKFPGANILFKTANQRVILFHNGAFIESDLAYFYSKDNYFSATGNVIFTQGDSLKMTCNSIEYDGKKQLALANGDVYLERPDMSLSTEKLNLDRINNEAFYDTKGDIMDSSSTLTSNNGVYFLNKKKYRFKSSVIIENPRYNVTSDQLEYLTEFNQAFLYDRSKITGDSYTIICDRGFYDLDLEKGIFKKNATLYYDNKIIKGDSLYFEKEKNYAAATKNVSILDSLNNSLITGNYGEIYKKKDSAIITQRALSINVIDKDSLFIHADTLVATGPKNRRILS